ncbi:hypothetical protein [Clostridium saccharobutylicum]|uniref:Uncharacterized protein n=1 Tax=Clostridium saccharobutylicum TaxID=169679 RepID=A0A1S8N5I7_CLOSA|nr:hypothetical protein [Clostridium saccharobutylicum]OOM11685.1 hypothetical protein CLOSAC_21120 [Clostridium saccharobutylicum]
MEEEKIEFKNSKSEEIQKKWFKIILFIYIPISFAIGILLKEFIKTSTYVVYYRSFIGDLTYIPGITLLLICLIVEEIIYFLKCKDNKKIIKLIIALMCICIITYKVIPYSGTYESYKDLRYVIEGTYCEDVQELKNVYINNTTGKLSSRTLYVETSDFKFIVHENIVDDNDFDEFKARFDKVKKVKIKYLPNTEILLSIQPVKD